MTAASDATILEAAVQALADGPMRLLELATRLRHHNAFEEFANLDDESLMLELDEILLDTDAVWVSQDQIVALVPALLDGVVFTHRLSGSELDRGVLDATPDLGAIDFDDPDGLALTTGELLKTCYPFDGQPELDENGSYPVPPGAMTTFGTSDLVFLRRSDLIVSLDVVPAAAAGSGELEERALGAAFEQQHIPGFGLEADELVLDALCHDPSLFRSPVPPVGELLGRIGLERRGAWFGRSGEDWEPPGVRALEREREALAESWGFDSCCEAAFETVRQAWHNHVTGDPSPDKDELRAVARGLAHGSVGPAFAEYVLRDLDDENELLASFAAGIAGLPGALAAPAHYLLGLEAERSGETGTAEDQLRAAVRADPDYGPALGELAWYEADRGEAQKAVSLFRRSQAFADDPELDYLTAQIPVPAGSAGRNDPCPCGSGRKFKTCCIGGRARTIEPRAGWLYHKIATFITRPQRQGRLEDIFLIASSGWGASAPEELFPLLVESSPSKTAASSTS